MKRATAYANANIALVKYWGKNDSDLNIPAVSSLSMTLKDLGTTVTIAQSNKNEHELIVEQKSAEKSALLRLANYLEQLRTRYPFDGFLTVMSKASVPYASGLASSASFFAALASAFSGYFGLNLSLKELSLIARMGSGSAARSIFPHFSGLYGGCIEHERAHAFPVAVHQKLKLAMVLAIVSEHQKPISSREAMIRTKETSPYFAAFVDSHHEDFSRALSALSEGSLERLGPIIEHSTLKMHASLWAAKPAINYWQPHTLALLELVTKIRDENGPIAFFTMDAGPNVKILCSKESLPFVIERVLHAKLAKEIRTSLPGEGATLLDKHLL